MIENNDWRLQGQEKYLTGVKLIRTPFTPLSKIWDHYQEWIALRHS